jgi:putative acetyltransferase
MDIRVDDLTGDKIRALLQFHVENMQGSSPPGTSYALDLSGLQTPDITVWTAWEDDALLGCGALKEIAPHWGEIKSMRTAPAHLHKGVGRAILHHVIRTARSRGYQKLSLETGNTDQFAAALALYQSEGFTFGDSFGDYRPSDFNVFLHLKL